MRYLGDQRGEIGYFEDLQTLVIIVIGISVLLGSTVFNWSAFGTVEEDQALFDEAEHIVEAIESWDRITAISSWGSMYEDFVLRQPELITLLKNPSQFTERIRSDLHLNVTFDDLEVDEGAHDPAKGIFASYGFGDALLDDQDNAMSIRVPYALVMERPLGVQQYDVSERHACLMTVVVWR
jgi:hypothetical protein